MTQNEGEERKRESGYAKERERERERERRDCYARPSMISNTILNVRAVFMIFVSNFKKKLCVTDPAWACNKVAQYTS